MDFQHKAGQRILVARLGALGDTLMATPVISALHGAYPGSRIDFLSSSAAAPLLQGHPGLGDVLSLGQRNWPLALSYEKLGLIWTMRRRGYDLAVLLESAPRYRRLLHAAGVDSIRSFREVPFHPGRHSICNNLAVALGSWEGPPPDMELTVTAEEVAEAEQWLKDLPRPVVGIHAGYGPGHRKTNQAERLKGWSLANFSRVASALLSRGCGVVLTGSAQDRPTAADLARSISGPRECIRNLAGATRVRQLAVLISRLSLLISVDSGPAHVAAALGTPLVVLWGPAKLQQVRPVSSRSPVMIVREPVPCAPCYDTPAMKTCRLNICMQRITPRQVLEAAEALLKSAGEAGLKQSTTNSTRL